MHRLSGLILAVVLFATGGCTMTESITSSGKSVTREFDIAGFDRIQAGSAFTVDITRGESYSVVVTIDENLVEYLDVEKQGDTLIVGMKPSLRFNLRDGEMRAVVSMPELTGLDLSGATRTTVAGFSGEQPLDVEVSGASRLAGDISCGHVRFNVSGASNVSLRGAADVSSVEASGASKVDLTEFVTQATTVNASGASNVSVSPEDTLDMSASGASHVTYSPGAIIGRINTSGASTVSER